MEATIGKTFSGATFIQLWRMQPGQQQDWLRTMHERIHLLQDKPGFQSMTLHPSLDGRNVVVYAQWTSREELQAAADHPEVRAARAQLDSHGEPDGTLFRVDSVHVRDQVEDGVLTFHPGRQSLVVITVWVTENAERQQPLLAALTQETIAIGSTAGSEGTAYHTSLDGSRLVAYELWDNPERFDAAVSNQTEEMENRRKLTRYGEPLVNTYRIDSVFFPLAANEAEI